MKNTIDFTAMNRPVRPSEIYPESGHVGVRAVNQYESYLVFNDEVVPQALEAYLNLHQRQWL